MVLWLEHPSYVAVRDRLVGYLRSDHYRFRHLNPILFLCGGAGSSSRNTLRDYLQKHAPDLGVFYAERVWEQISSHTNRSALEMESDLASLADLVVIIVESPGTFAELGAFSLSKPLRKKVLAIVDKEYASNQHSFLATGPLRWIHVDSKFAPTVFTPLNQILEGIDQIEERISRIARSRTVRISDLAESPKHLLFFLCDLISVIHPATEEIIGYYLGQIAPSILPSDIDISTLIGLGVAMDLLRADKIEVRGESNIFFSPAEPNAVEYPFHHRRLLDLESLRATHVAVLLSLPEAKVILDHLRSIS